MIEGYYNFVKIKKGITDPPTSQSMYIFKNTNSNCNFYPGKFSLGYQKHFQHPTDYWKFACNRVINIEVI